MPWPEYSPAGLPGSPGQQGAAMRCRMQAVAVCGMRCGMRCGMQVVAACRMRLLVHV